MVVMGSDADLWADRARLAWEQLLATSVNHRRGHVQVLDGPGRRHGLAALWPFSQVLAAALQMAHLPHGERAARTVDALGVEVERYWSREGYATHPGRSERYHDDNAWLGLDAVDAALMTTADGQDAAARRWWDVAVRATRFVLAGQQPDGGIHWVQPRAGRRSPCNACSTAPGIALALRVLRSHPELAADEGAALALAASRADAWLWSTLGAPEGVLWDHQEPDGTIERTVWSYNQGAAIAADVAWWQLTGEDRHLARARATANAALAWFAMDDRLWREPPAFVAILLRELVRLHRLTPRADVPLVLDGYAQRVWTDGRNPANGRFTEGGIGAYRDGGTLDHAGVVQVLALRALVTP